MNSRKRWREINSPGSPAFSGETPARIERSSFRIEVVTAPLEPHHEDGVLRAVKSCLIHNTLLHPPAMEVVVNATSAVAA